MNKSRTILERSSKFRLHVFPQINFVGETFVATHANEASWNAFWVPLSMCHIKPSILLHLANPHTEHWYSRRPEIFVKF